MRSAASAAQRIAIAPRLISTRRSAPTEVSVASAPLLHVTDGSVQPPLPGWQDWLRAAGVSTLIAGDLQSGRLVGPFERALPIPQTYTLTYPPEYASSPALRRFRSWLLGHA